MTSPGAKRLSRSRYEYFIGLRYIRSHGGNRFISFISMSPMLGIALAVAVLIVLLSVMTGFGGPPERVKLGGTAALMLVTMVASKESGPPWM